MLNRIPESELAEMEAKKDIYPHVSVIDYLNQLRDAYAEIDRLQAVQFFSPKLLRVLEKILKHPTGYMEPYMMDERAQAEAAIAEEIGREA